MDRAKGDARTPFRHSVSLAVNYEQSTKLIQLNVIVIQCLEVHTVLSSQRIEKHYRIVHNIIIKCGMITRHTVIAGTRPFPHVYIRGFRSTKPLTLVTR